MWYSMLMGIASRRNIKPWDNDKDVLLKVAVTDKVHDEVQPQAGTGTSSGSSIWK